MYSQSSDHVPSAAVYSGPSVSPSDTVKSEFNRTSVVEVSASSSSSSWKCRSLNGCCWRFNEVEYVDADAWQWDEVGV